MLRTDLRRINLTSGDTQSEGSFLHPLGHPTPATPLRLASHAYTITKSSLACQPSASPQDLPSHPSGLLDALDEMAHTTLKIGRENAEQESLTSRRNLRLHLNHDTTSLE